MLLKTLLLPSYYFSDGYGIVICKTNCLRYKLYQRDNQLKHSKNVLVFFYFFSDCSQMVSTQPPKCIKSTRITAKSYWFSNRGVRHPCRPNHRWLHVSSVRDYLLFNGLTGYPINYAPNLFSAVHNTSNLSNCSYWLVARILPLLLLGLNTVSPRPFSGRLDQSDGLLDARV